jgi:hypothetical protein
MNFRQRICEAEIVDTNGKSLQMRHLCNDLPFVSN